MKPNTDCRAYEIRQEPDLATQMCGSRQLLNNQPKLASPVCTHKGDGMATTAFGFLSDPKIQRSPTGCGGLISESVLSPKPNSRRRGS